MAESFQTKILVIGSGPAGATAAIYAARAGLAPIMVHGLQPGGQLTITTDVENYPGFADTIQGPWLMEQMEAQAKHVGATIIHDIITEIDLTKRPFTATGDSGNQYTGETVIIATGAQAKWLGLDSEQEFRGFGVSACAACDGFFFRGKDVIVVGGGNTAVEEALYLTNHANRVTVIHRKNAFRAEKILQERLAANPKISVIWDSVIEDVVGGTEPKGVTGARIRNLKSGQTTVVHAGGIFIAIGHSPNTELFREKLQTDAEGYLVTKPGTTQTDVPGIFAAGDVQDKIYRQAVTAAGSGCMAALEAQHFLSRE